MNRGKTERDAGSNRVNTWGEGNNILSSRGGKGRGRGECKPAKIGEDVAAKPQQIEM